MHHPFPPPHEKQCGARGKRRGISPAAAARPLDWTRVREHSVKRPGGVSWRQTFGRGECHLPSGDDPHNSGPIQWRLRGWRPSACRAPPWDLFPRGFGGRRCDECVSWTLAASFFLFFRLLIHKLLMSIKIEIRGPSPRCLFTIKESFVYFIESHRDSTIALRMEILSTFRATTQGMWCVCSWPACSCDLNAWNTG